MTTRNPFVQRGLAALLFLTVGCAPGQGSETERLAAQDPAAAVADTAAAQSLSATFRAAAQRAERSVVYIEVEKEAEAMAPQDVPEPFRFFFGPEGPQQGPEVQRGAGSGFVLDDQGHIVTNHHVVEGADYVRVTALDRREFDAEVVGSDPDTDIAIIKIQQADSPLPPAALGSSQRVQVGDWVLALGNPLGLNFTVTAGIVSAKGRQIGIGGTALESFIQTDAAINMGNSGGPLVDLQGRVVGINTLIYGGMRNIGYGFAVPIDVAKKVVEDILEYGYVRRPRLGVGVQSVDAVDAEVFGLDRVAGAIVGQVEPGTPAAEAGLETGDVIVSLDGEPVETSGERTARLAPYEPGDAGELGVVRYGGRMTRTVELGEFPHDDEEAAPEETRRNASEKLGFSVQPLTAQVAEQLGYENPEGVIVAQVRPNSSAALAGIQRGLKILSINRQAVASVGDVDRIAGDLEPGSIVSLRVEIPGQGETIINYRARR